MVQIVENWSDIEGEIQEVRPDPELPGHLVATVQVSDAKPVPKPDGGEYPNLLAEATGGTVDIHVTEEAAARQQLAAGRRVSARVRRATPTRSFADPERLTTS
jgi:hypothetical protein